jgi:hypothetical protein
MEQGGVRDEPDGVMEEWYEATLEWCFGAKPPIFFEKREWRCR